MNKMITVTLLIAIIGALVPVHAASAAISEPGFETEVVAGGFVLPTTIAFADDGRIFVAEKGGVVRVIKNGVLLPTPVITLTDVNTFGDRGLLGIATDPNFLSNGYLYLSYTFENTPGANVGGEKTGRIVRVTVSGDTADESSKFVLVGTVGGDIVSPSCEDFATTDDCLPSDSPSHSVGGLRFGPDGMLYATTGDGAHFDYADPRSLRAQDLDSLAGKVLRINTDGTAPSDNPFYTGDPNANQSKVFALGVRNSFRFNFDPINGGLFAGDVGWSTWEEINLIAPGANLGWPCIEGPDVTSHGCSPSSTPTAPLYTYLHNASGAGSVTGGAFADSNAYPDAYDTSYFFGDYAQNWIKRMVLDSSYNVVSVEDFDTSPDGPVEFATGPDGNIYYLSIYTGELKRITHTDGNRKPVADFTATPSSGLLPLEVAFNSSASYDPDLDVLSYSWNFGDGVTSTEQNPTHTYTTAGTFSASLTLTDTSGAVGSKSISITAGNQKPQATITSPASGTLYVVGEDIQLDAVASDLEDGILPASAYHWTIILHHNTHIHIIQEFDGVTNPSFIAPDHSASDVYTEVQLTVTDSAGLTDTRSINLYLNNGGGSGNLIANPSLEIADETSGQPLSWHTGWYGSLNPIFTYPVPGLAGASAAKLEITSYTDGDAKWYFDPVFVTSGATYTFKNTYTATVPTVLTLQYGLSNGTYQYGTLADLPVTATPIQNVYLFTVPDGVQTVAVFHELEAVGELVVDDYSLELSTSSGDTEVPVGTVTNPENGTTVSGVLAINVSATDNVAVAEVHLVIDGIVTAFADTEAPYAFSFDTTTLSEGVHTISAHIHDTSENEGVAPSIAITVHNASNLVSNPNLEIEDGSEPLDWGKNSWGNHTAVFTYPVTGYNGEKAARVEITSYPVDGSGDAKWFFNKIPVTPGTVYTYTDHYRSNTISDIIGQYTLADGSFHYFGLHKEIPPSSEWATAGGTFTPPANATHVTFFHLISAVGFLEIDDVDFYESGSGTPSETNAPIVEFTSPIQSQTVSGTIGITASSTDDTAVTYIFYAVDGIPVTGQLTNAPYLFNWDTNTVSNGTHTLKATTHDPFGNNSTHTITVTVDNSGTPPGPGNLIQNPSLETVGGNGDPLHWFRGGWGTNNRAFTYPVAGTEGARAARVEITSYTDGDAKWYFEDVPVTGGTTYVVNYDIRSNVETEMLARVQLDTGAYQYLFIGTMPASPTWDNLGINLVIPANGTHVTLFHVVRSVGWMEFDNFTMFDPNAVSDTTPPSVSVTSPVALEEVQGVVTIAVNAADDVGVSGVTLLVDGIAVLTEDVSAPFTFSWSSLSVPNGAHDISARARDAAGNTTTSSVVTIMVNNVATTNLVLNPSLETVGGNGDPLHWTRGGWGTNTRTYTYPVAGFDGASAARVSIAGYVDGDAKWVFEDVPVTGGGTYSLSHAYRSDVTTNVTIRYTLSGGGFQYVSLGNKGPAASWTTISHTFVAPLNAVSMTVMHIVYSNGYLEIDNVMLTDGNDNAFDFGMISYTFDDGWLSHFTNALPILDAAGVDGTFYIVSLETGGATPTESIPNANLESLGGNGDPSQWFRGGWGTNTRTYTYPEPGNGGGSAVKVEITEYTDGDAKWFFADAPVIPNHDYIVELEYKSNTSSELLARYAKADGSFSYVGIQSLDATGDAWVVLTDSITVPADAVSVTLFHLIASVGYVATDNYSLVRVQDFVDQQQMLAIQASGHEIGGHSRTHPSLTSISLSEAEIEIEGSRNEILAMGGVGVTAFAYPFGDYNDEVQALAEAAGYTSARSVDRGYNTKATDKYALKIQQVGRTTTIADIQGWIAQALADKTWLILMFHQVDNDLNQDLGVSPAFLQEIVDYAGTTGITPVTVEEAVQLMNP